MFRQGEAVTGERGEEGRERERQERRGDVSRWHQGSVDMRGVIISSAFAGTAGFFLPRFLKSTWSERVNIFLFSSRKKTSPGTKCHVIITVNDEEVVQSLLPSHHHHMQSCMIESNPSVVLSDREITVQSRSELQLSTSHMPTIWFCVWTWARLDWV